MNAQAFYSLLFFLCHFGLFAGEAVIKGNINPFTEVPEIVLASNSAWKDGKNQRFKAPVDNKGNFELKIDIFELGVYSLGIGQTSVPIVLEANDFIDITVNPDAVISTLKFNGQGSLKNKALYDYYKTVNYNFNPFAYRKYKKGQLWFSIAPNVETSMTNNPGNRFLLTMESRKQDALATFNAKYASSPRLSADFKEFIKTEIDYHHAYEILAYHMAYKGRHDLKNEMIDPLITFSKDLNPKKIKNYWYRNFMLNYFNYMCILEERNFNPTFETVDEFYGENLSNDILAYCQSELIRAYVKRDGPIVYLNTYNAFLDSDEKENFHDKVIYIFNERSKGYAGLPAPKFLLSTLDGNIVGLDEQISDEKLVLVNFWATWCKPCMKKMPQFYKFKELVGSNKVEIIHVSLDRNKDALKKYIDTNGVPGKHVWVKDGANKKQIEDFKISALPAWSLINESGIYEPIPPKSTVTDLVGQLKSLINE